MDYRLGKRFNLVASVQIVRKFHYTIQRKLIAVVSFQATHRTKHHAKTFLGQRSRTSIKTGKINYTTMYKVSH